MSNFSFLDIENEYTRNDAYKLMVEYVKKSEGFFYVMDTACGLNARYAIEQYVEFISVLYDIDYPYEPKQLAHYLYGENAKTLIQKVGEETFGVLWTINDLSKPYMHIGIPRSDKNYHEILPRLYDLMRDLYKRIGGKTTTVPRQFRFDKIETLNEIITPDGKKMRIVSSEEIAFKVPSKESISTKPMYEIRKQRGSIYLVDKEGSIYNRFVDYEKYQGTEEEKKELKKKLKKIENTYQSVVDKMSAEINQREEQITDLRGKLNGLSEYDTQYEKQITRLKSQISQLESDKRAIRLQADEQIQKLQEMWLAADNKYRTFYSTSAEEQKELKAEIAKLLKAREDIRNELVQTEAEYNVTINKLKLELEKAKKVIDSYYDNSSGNLQVISELKSQIEFLEKEKKEYVVNFEKRYNEVKIEIAKLLENKEQQNIEWQKLVSQLIFENDYYREFYVKKTKKEEKEYLSVVKNKISQINEQTSLYQPNISEQMLRAYLLKVRNAYEEVIEKERKRADYWKNKYEAERMMPKENWEEVQDEEEPEEEPVYQQSMKTVKRNNTGILLVAMVSVVCLLVVLLVFLGRDTETKDDEREVLEPDKIIVNTELSVSTEALISTEGMTEKETQIETEEIIPSEETESIEDTMTTEESIDSEVEIETETQVSTEEVINSEVGNNNSLPDGSVIQDALNKKQPPEKWTELDGINEDLINEIASINRNVLDYYPIAEEKYGSQGYQYLGEHGIFNTSYNAWDQRGIFQEDLYTNTNFSYVQFFYYRSNTDGTIGIAVLPDALSSEINAYTTVEELTELFAEEPSYMGELPGVTVFSTAEKEIGVVYKVGYSFDVLFLFNEDGLMCDYVYISARSRDILEEE